MWDRAGIPRVVQADEDPKGAWNGEKGPKGHGPGGRIPRGVQGAEEAQGTREWEKDPKGGECSGDTDP